MKSISKNFFQSITFSISLTISLVVALTSVIIAWLILQEVRYLLELELKKKGLYIAEIISQQLIEPFLYEEKYVMYTISQTAMGVEEGMVVHVSIYDGSGEPILSLTKEKLSLPPINKEKVLGLKESILSEESNLGIYLITTPLMTKGLGTIGYLRLGITKKFLRETLAEIRRKVIFLSTLIVFMGIIIGVMMARKIIQPLVLLHHGVRKIADGEYGIKIEVAGIGEIKRLALAFNEMSTKLNESVEAIKAVQETLVRTEKLYALGEFAASLAHEIKNPLTSIKMLMQASRESNVPLNAMDLKMIEGELNRIDRIVRDFLNFARPAKTKLEISDLNEIIKEVVGICRPKIERAKIKILEDYDVLLPKIKVNPDGIRQVVLNILLNALQAIENDGTIHIATSVVEGYVSVCVIDTGLGIPEAHLPRIFDPFFTTKEEGTGMGLAIAYNIIKEHGGEIKVDSQVNNGTIVGVYLPIHEK